MMNNFVDIIAAPNQAMTRLQEKPTWFLPWLLVCVLTASMQFGFYSSVDPQYLIDQLVEQNLQPGVSESDLRASMQGLAENTSTLAITSSVAIFVVLLVVYAITAGYLYMISKFSGKDVNYKSWYSLAAWSGIPAVFTALAGWIVILTSNGLIDVEAMNPLNLNYLLLRNDGDYAGILNALNLMAIWSIVLMILGYKKFTSASSIQSAIVVLTPYLLILLVWALIIML